jgi:hypothetical protein
MSELRKYLLPDNLDLTESDTKAAKSGFSRFSHYPEDLYQWYLESEYFGNLSYAEKALAYKALGLSKDSGPWHIGLAMDHAEDKLFPFESPTAVMQADAYDAEVLSGALGADLLDDAKEFMTDEESAEAMGHETYDLNRLVAIGALSRSRESFLSVGASITIQEPDGSERQVGVGGDLNGDFCMVETVGFKGKTVAPNGLAVPFSPLEPTFIYGYHSVELDITEICLRHATGSMSKEERAWYFDGLTKRSCVNENNNRTRAFGDYGSSLERRFWIVDENEPLRQGTTIESFMVKPGSQEIKLDIRSMPDGVMFAQTQRLVDGDGYYDVATIVIPDAHVLEFIAALRDADMGRVAPYEIEQLARMMLLDDNKD